MSNTQLAASFELLCVIVNNKIGAKVLRIAKGQGVQGGTIVFGHGTANSGLLRFFALDDVRKELVFIVAESSVARKTVEAVCAQLQLHKPNRGILFSIPLTQFCGAHDYTCGVPLLTEQTGGSMYSSITIIVEKGKAEFAVDAARKAGARGATIINGRGSGIHEAAKLFGMEIEPEKELILIVVEDEKTENIVTALMSELDMEKPGNGIIFVQKIQRVCGLTQMNV